MINEKKINWDQTTRMSLKRQVQKKREQLLTCPVYKDGQGNKPSGEENNSEAEFDSSRSDFEHIANQNSMHSTIVRSFS